MADSGDSRFEKLSGRLHRAFQEKNMMMSEIQSLKKQLRQVALVNSDDEKGSWNRLIETSVRSGMMACMWCMKAQVVKKISIAFHRWKTISQQLAVQKQQEEQMKQEQERLQLQLMQQKQLQQKQLEEQLEQQKREQQQQEQLRLQQKAKSNNEGVDISTLLTYEGSPSESSVASPRTGNNADADAGTPGAFPAVGAGSNDIGANATVNVTPGQMSHSDAVLKALTILAEAAQGAAGGGGANPTNPSGTQSRDNNTTPGGSNSAFPPELAAMLQAVTSGAYQPSSRSPSGSGNATAAAHKGAGAPASSAVPGTSAAVAGSAPVGSSSSDAAPRTPFHSESSSAATAAAVPSVAVRPPSIGDFFQASSHASSHHGAGGGGGGDDNEALDNSARDLDLDPDLVQKRALLLAYAKDILSKDQKRGAGAATVLNRAIASGQLVQAVGQPESLAVSRPGSAGATRASAADITAAAGQQQSGTAAAQAVTAAVAAIVTLKPPTGSTSPARSRSGSHGGGSPNRGGGRVPMSNRIQPPATGRGGGGGGDGGSNIVGQSTCSGSIAGQSHPASVVMDDFIRDFGQDDIDRRNPFAQSQPGIRTLSGTNGPIHRPEAADPYGNIEDPAVIAAERRQLQIQHQQQQQKLFYKGPKYMAPTKASSNKTNTPPSSHRSRSSSNNTFIPSGSVHSRSRSRSASAERTRTRPLSSGGNGNSSGDGGRGGGRRPSQNQSSAGGGGGMSDYEEYNQNYHSGPFRAEAAPVPTKEGPYTRYPSAPPALPDDTVDHSHHRGRSSHRYDPPEGRGGQHHESPVRDLGPSPRQDPRTANRSSILRERFSRGETLYPETQIPIDPAPWNQGPGFRMHGASQSPPPRRGERASSPTYDDQSPNARNSSASPSRLLRGVDSGPAAQPSRHHQQYTAGPRETIYQSHSKPRPPAVVGTAAAAAPTSLPIRKPAVNPALPLFPADIAAARKTHHALSSGSGNQGTYVDEGNIRGLARHHLEARNQSRGQGHGGQGQGGHSRRMDAHSPDHHHRGQQGAPDYHQHQRGQRPEVAADSDYIDDPSVSEITTDGPAWNNIAASGAPGAAAANHQPPLRDGPGSAGHPRTSSAGGHHLPPFPADDSRRSRAVGPGKGYDAYPVRRWDDGDDDASVGDEEDYYDDADGDGDERYPQTARGRHPHPRDRPSTGGGNHNYPAATTTRGRSSSHNEGTGNVNGRSLSAGKGPRQNDSSGSLLNSMGMTKAQYRLLYGDIHQDRNLPWAKSLRR